MQVNKFTENIWGIDKVLDKKSCNDCISAAEGDNLFPLSIVDLAEINITHENRVFISSSELASMFWSKISDIVPQKYGSYTSPLYISARSRRSMQLLCHHFLIYFIMKKLSRDAMKKVMGGNGPGCGDYQGQTTYVCGTRNDPNTGCHVDFCFCNGTPVPLGYDVLSEDQTLCG